MQIKPKAIEKDEKTETEEEGINNMRVNDPKLVFWEGGGVLFQVAGLLAASR